MDEMMFFNFYSSSIVLAPYFCLGVPYQDPLSLSLFSFLSLPLLSPLLFFFSSSSFLLCPVLFLPLKRIVYIFSVCVCVCVCHSPPWVVVVVGEMSRNE